MVFQVVYLPVSGCVFDFPHREDESQVGHGLRDLK